MAALPRRLRVVSICGATPIGERRQAVEAFNHGARRCPGRHRHRRRRIEPPPPLPAGDRCRAALESVAARAAHRPRRSAWVSAAACTGCGCFIRTPIEERVLERLQLRRRRGGWLDDPEPIDELAVAAAAFGDGVAPPLTLRVWPALASRRTAGEHARLLQQRAVASIAPAADHACAAVPKRNASSRMVALHTVAYVNGCGSLVAEQPCAHAVDVATSADQSVPPCVAARSRVEPARRSPSHVEEACGRSRASCAACARHFGAHRGDPIADRCASEHARGSAIAVRRPRRRGRSRSRATRRTSTRRCSGAAAASMRVDTGAKRTPRLVAAVAGDAAVIAGFGGELISHAFVEQELLPSATADAQLATFERQFIRWWRTSRRSLGPASSARSVHDVARRAAVAAARPRSTGDGAASARLLRRRRRHRHRGAHAAMVDAGAGGLARRRDGRRRRRRQRGRSSSNGHALRIVDCTRTWTRHGHRLRSRADHVEPEGHRGAVASATAERWPARTRACCARSCALGRARDRASAVRSATAC